MTSRENHDMNYYRYRTSLVPSITFNNLLLVFSYNRLGNSANAVPHYQKLYSRVNNICVDRRGQPSRGAMARPRPEGTAFKITVTPEPGKYDCTTFLPTISKLTIVSIEWELIAFISTWFPHDPIASRRQEDI